MSIVILSSTMNFYSEKRRAIAIIDKLLADGKSEDAITMVIQRDFGFSSRIVRERIALLKRLRVGQDGEGS